MTGATAVSIKDTGLLSAGIRRGIFPAAILGLVQFVMTLIWIGRPSYWGDEAATIAATARPIQDLPRLVAHIDAVHTAYYLLQGSYMSVVGTSPSLTRLTSAAALALTVSGIVVLGTRLGGRRVGLYAGAIAILLPGLAWTGMEVRSFSLTALLAVGTVLAVEAASRASGWRLWSAYAILLALSTWIFVFAAMVALPCAVLALQRGRFRAYAGASAAAALASAPIVIVTQAQAGQVGWIENSAAGLAYDVAVGQFFFGQRPYDAEAGILGLCALALAAMAWGTIAAGIVRGHRSGMVDNTAVLGIWVVAPALILVGLTLLGKPLYLERYLTFTAPALCIWLGASFAALKPRVGIAALCAFAFLAAPILVHQKTEGAKPDNYAALAEWVAERKEPDSAVIYSTIRARGVSVSYPEAFEGIDDVARLTGPVDMGTFWGSDLAPGDLPLEKVTGKSVFVFNLTQYPGGYPDAADPLAVAADDPYVTQLTGSGCRIEDASSVTTFTAYLLRC
ncbi:hypothetical protein [Arthrobacter sp. Br18]|uniref:glycosyltransferase family 39 protein n=1 Tax=Arthrobacter sp. Br18 TaxID=1312954 RepID=UPI00047BD7F8|nr:hypothetical protein [Arthrobacter sp. Br18]